MLYIYGKFVISFHIFINALEISVLSKHLAVEIERGLPGWNAQRIMSARGREPLSDTYILQRNPRRSSVLVWLYPHEGQVFTRLILRTLYKGVHSGQISLPGGAMEESDTDLWETALREANEEIGLPKATVERIGELTPLYIPPSNFWVQPFIGITKTVIPPVIDIEEVQRVIDLEVFLLLNPVIKEERMIYHAGSGKKESTKGYNINGDFVWGATAMILSELEELLRRILQPEKS